MPEEAWIMDYLGGKPAPVIYNCLMVYKWMLVWPTHPYVIWLHIYLEQYHIPLGRAAIMNTPYLPTHLVLLVYSYWYISWLELKIHKLLYFTFKIMKFHFEMSNLPFESFSSLTMLILRLYCVLSQCRVNMISPDKYCTQHRPAYISHIFSSTIVSHLRVV